MYHCGVEVTESSTNKQHTLSLATHPCYDSLGCSSAHWTVTQVSVGAMDACEWGPHPSPPPEGASHLQPVRRHAGLGFSVLCLLRTNWSTGERLCGGDANALAEELEPLWLITLLLRVPEAFGCYISPHSARSACRLTALVRTNLRCRVRVRVRSEMEACVDLRGHGVVLGVHESI